MADIEIFSQGILSFWDMFGKLFWERLWDNWFFGEIGREPLEYVWATLGTDFCLVVMEAIARTQQ